MPNASATGGAGKPEEAPRDASPSQCFPTTHRPRRGRLDGASAPAAGAGRGRYCRLEPLSAARHAAELYQAFSQAPDGRDWTYMSVGPFASEAEYRAFAERAEAGQDPCTMPSSTWPAARPWARCR